MLSFEPVLAIRNIGIKHELNLNPVESDLLTFVIRMLQNASNDTSCEHETPPLLPTPTTPTPTNWQNLSSEDEDKAKKDRKNKKDRKGKRPNKSFDENVDHFLAANQVGEKVSFQRASNPGSRNFAMLGLPVSCMLPT